VTDTHEKSAEERLSNSLEEIVVEAWRFSRLFQTLLFKIDGGEQSRYRNQFRYFIKKLEDGLAAANLRIVNLEGQEFDPGIAATALNLGDFDDDIPLVIDQMIEPVIMGPNGLVRSGTVILRKVN
jgi:hypothetical protein